MASTYDAYETPRVVFSSSTQDNNPDLDKYTKDVKVLEDLVSEESQEKYYKAFEGQACYLGNGVYTISGLFSQDTRQLFLMFCLQQEDVEMERFSRKMADIKWEKENGEDLPF